MSIVRGIVSLIVVLVGVCKARMADDEDLFVLNMTLTNYHSSKVIFDLSGIDANEYLSFQ